MGRCKTSTSISLFDLQRRYCSNQYFKPNWQRGDVWPQRKKDEFERTVDEKARQGGDILSGCIVLYTTQDNPGQVYISDGLQRTLNAAKIFQKWSKSLGPADAEKRLSRVCVPALEMDYADEIEAKREFRRINLGTPLTEKEEAKTILTDLVNYSLWEDGFFKALHAAVTDALQRFGVKPSMSRSRKHSSERDDFALFLRYATKNKNAEKYSFDVKSIDDAVARSKIIEQQLVDYLERVGLDHVQKELRDFQRFVDKESAFIKEIWEMVPKTEWSSDIQTLTEVCLRICLHLAIYRSNNDIPVLKYEEFLREFLKACRGTSNVRFSDGGYVVVAKADLSRLPRLQEKLGVSMHEIHRKRRNVSQITPGYHSSHKKSVARHGEGETVVMSGTRNQSMGVLSIDDV